MPPAPAPWGGPPRRSTPFCSPTHRGTHRGPGSRKARETPRCFSSRTWPERRVEPEEFLARTFAGGGQRSERTFQARGQDVSYVLPVPFLDATNGAVRTITLPEGKTLHVAIPEGAEDRQMLRLKGQGMPGFGGGPAGDAYVELHVEPHPHFRRKDDNIHVEVPVTLKEAMLGARIEVPTINGPVSVAVPKGSNTGTTLRLRDRGIRNRKTGQRGHQFVTLKVVLPPADEPELAAFLESWRPTHFHDPREEMLK